MKIRLLYCTGEVQYVRLLRNVCSHFFSSENIKHELSRALPVESLRPARHNFNKRLDKEYTDE